MTVAPEWNDVASFVADYLSGSGTVNAGRRTVGPRPALLAELTQAYIEARGLSAAARYQVMAMVDSVL